MSGLAKRFVCPGFCCEWLVIKDSNNKIKKVAEILGNIEHLYGMPPTPLINNLDFFFEMQNPEISKKRMAIVEKNYHLLREAFENCEDIKDVFQ